jgi:hypothetical protein
MSLSLNGWSYGKAVITTSGDVPSTITVLLPMTNYGGGLEEKTDFLGNTVNLVNFDIDNRFTIKEQDPYGFNISYAFHYEDFILGSDLFDKFLPLIKAWFNKWTIVLTPRIDVPERYFTVNLTNDSLILQLRRGGAMAKYHKGVLFTFETKRSLTDLQWTLQPDTTPASVTGRIQIWVTTS